jgi:hypothetical protein
MPVQKRPVVEASPGFFPKTVLAEEETPKATTSCGDLAALR